MLTDLLMVDSNMFYLSLSHSARLKRPEERALLFIYSEKKWLSKLKQSSLQSRRAALTGFASQAKPVRFMSAGASARNTPSLFGFNPGNATGTQGIGI